MSIIIPVLDGLVINLKNHDDSALLNSAMSHYAHYTVQFNQDFFKTPINDPKISPYISKILKLLELPPLHVLRFTNASLTFKEFLSEVHALKRENAEIKHILELVEKQTKASRQKLFLIGGLSVLGIGVPLGVLSTIFPIFSALYAIASFIPAIALTYTVGIAGISFYQFKTDKLISFEKRFTENILFLASKAMQVLAYSLLVAGVLSASPVIGIFFVLAEAVILEKELVSLWKLHRAYQKTLKDDSISPHELVRLKMDYEKERNKVLIDLAVAVSFVVIVAVMSFLTGGLIIPVASFAAIGVVLLMKKLAVSSNNEMMKTKLQKEFSLLERDMEDSEKSNEIECVLQEGIELNDEDTFSEKEQLLPAVRHKKAISMRDMIQSTLTFHKSAKNQSTDTTDEISNEMQPSSQERSFKR